MTEGISLLTGKNPYVRIFVHLMVLLAMTIGIFTPVQSKDDYSQDLNLHYVGITRAKKCCVLCTSTHRQSNGQIIAANPSEFLFLNNVEQLRLQIDI